MENATSDGKLDGKHAMPHDSYLLECLCLAAGCPTGLQSSVRAWPEAEPQKIG